MHALATCIVRTVFWVLPISQDIVVFSVPQQSAAFAPPLRSTDITMQAEVI